MPRIYQAPEGAATSSPSKIATMQCTPGRSRRLANEPVNLCVASAWPLSNGSPRGPKDFGKDRLHHARENGAISPAPKATTTQQSPGRIACQPKNLFGASARPLPTTSPGGRKKDSGKQRLRQFWTQVLENPDAAQASSPSRQRPQVAEDGPHRKTGKCAPTSVKGCAVAPTKGQCRQPFTLVQPREITGHPISRLPRLLKPRLQATASNASKQVQALPQSLPASPLSDHCRQRIADLQAEGIARHLGSHLPQHVQPCVPLAEHKDSGLMQAHPLHADALPLGDCVREPPEAVMDGIQTKMCTPQRPPADHEGSDTSLSSGSSYSPLPPPVALEFKTPDFERFRSPFKDCTIGRVASKTPTSPYDDSSPELVSPVTETTDVKKMVAFPLPDSPAHYTDAPEQSGSAENFPLAINVTLRRRRATRNMSPLALPELLPEHLAERLEPKPEDEKDSGSGESDSDEDTDSAALSSARAPAVPYFPSPDVAAYRSTILEEMAKCYGARLASPASSADSPASTASVVSTGGNVASSPTAEIAAASSPSTLATAFARLSAQPRPSPIFKSKRQERCRLSTVMECTEMSVKGSMTTALRWCLIKNSGEAKQAPHVSQANTEQAVPSTCSPEI
ncbi:uncharacterized protein LOC119397404 [Rhipicephalus sanguineus]|uniref:uncharacterized protein LOC119397404 n=1 Tax=Rhipicephalus sanguineus TaxID=34632 RepID=UPI001894BFCC|nr:uncharacterized protein LOC119397404 [Rhipicephalus sanguineus]